MGLFGSSKVKTVYDEPPEYAKRYSKSLSEYLQDLYGGMRGQREGMEQLSQDYLKRIQEGQGMTEAQQQAAGYYQNLLGRTPEYYLQGQDYEATLANMLANIQKATEKAQYEAATGGLRYGLTPSSSGKVQKSIVESALAGNLAEAQARADVERQMAQDYMNAIQAATQYGVQGAAGLQQLPGLSEILAQLQAAQTLPYGPEMALLQLMQGYQPIYTRPTGTYQTQAGPGWGLLSGLLGGASSVLGGWLGK